MCIFYNHWSPPSHFHMVLGLYSWLMKYVHLVFPLTFTIIWFVHIRTKKFVLLEDSWSRRDSFPLQSCVWRRGSKWCNLSCSLQCNSEARCNEGRRLDTCTRKFSLSFFREHCIRNLCKFKPLQLLAVIAYLFYNANSRCLGFSIFFLLNLSNTCWNTPYARKISRHKIVGYGLAYNVWWVILLHHMVLEWTNLIKCLCKSTLITVG